MNKIIFLFVLILNSSCSYLSVHETEQVSASRNIASEKNCNKLVQDILKYSLEEIYIGDSKVTSKDPILKALHDGIGVDEIRAESGRLGKKYVAVLPELTGTEKDAFDGAISQVIIKPGRVLWQVQRSGQENFGRWFSTDVPKDIDEAEKLFYLKAWGNDRGQLRLVIIKDEFTAYVGKVAGGEGNQLFIPRNVPVDDVARSISKRVTPGGKLIRNEEELTPGMDIEIHMTSTSSSSFHRGIFEGIKDYNSKSGGRYLRIIERKGSYLEIPFHDFSSLEIRAIKFAPPVTSKASTSNPSILGMMKLGTEVEIPHTSIDSAGKVIETRTRGKFMGSGPGIVKVELSDGTVRKIPYNEISTSHIREIAKEPTLSKKSTLRKNESYFNNLLPGDEIEVKTISKNADGHSESHTIEGVYNGTKQNTYIAIKRYKDDFPIYVRTNEIPEQKVRIIREVTQQISDVMTERIPYEASVQFTVRQKDGTLKTVSGTLISMDDNVVIKTKEGVMFGAIMTDIVGKVEMIRKKVIHER